MPQQECEANLEPWLRGDRALEIEAAGAPARASQQRAGDLRPRDRALGKCVVQQRKAARYERPPLNPAREQLLVLSPPGLENVAGAHKLGRDPVADVNACR